MSYDRALTVFSPDGHLFQVEYAMEAVSKGTTLIAIRGGTTAVLASEKKTIPRLQSPGMTAQKIVRLDEGVWAGWAGLTADARVLLGKGRVECQSYRLTLGEAPSVEYVARWVAGVQQEYTQKGGSRPFGVCCLVIGMDDYVEYGGNLPHDTDDAMTGQLNAGGQSHVGARQSCKPRLFLTEPSGLHSEWAACAIGRGSKTVREYLEQKLSKGAESADQLDEQSTIKLAIEGLLEVVQTGPSSMEVAVLSAGAPNSLRMLSAEEIGVVVDGIERERADEAERRRTATF